MPLVQWRMTFDDLLERATSLARPGTRAVLGITGSPGAGKTTLAERLVRELNGDGPPWVAHVPMDGFHLADAELDRLGRRARKGAPDTFDAAGYAALLRRLREGTDGQTVYAPGFERVLEQPIAGAVPVAPAARLIVTEGNYLLVDTGAWAAVRVCLDEVWFCELDEKERVRRLVARHEEFGKSHDEAVAWVLGTDQRNADLVATTRGRADLVVPASALGAFRASYGSLRKSARDSAPLVVGIDVGGTKTHLRAFAGKKCVADHVRPSGGWRPHHPADAAEWLAGLIHDALPRGARPAAVAVGGHACETPRQCERIRAALYARVQAPALVVGDAELLVPAAGLCEGVGLVAGTGSVAVGRLADGRTVQVGGWGAVLGDEGGSAGLVREAARAAWAAHDRGEAPDELALRLVAAFGVSEVPELGAALESSSDVSSEWGRHAPVVFEAAEAGSPLALEVIAAGGRALAGLVVRLAERGVPAGDVVVAGSTVLARPALYDAFAAALAEAVVGAEPRPLRVPPVQGAVTLARSLL